jgi:LysR family glycine cleavage system transcriptional activator
MLRLPGLPAMRVFEAAARHLSFTRAASELGVTPAAVSNQIRVLEDQLGRRLFTRTSRAMQLTSHGEVLLGGVTEAFAILSRTVQQITTVQRPRLSITTSPSFAAKWLVPRLAGFQRANPEIDVSVDVSDRVIELGGQGAQVAIRFGGGTYPGMTSDRLFDEFLFPVCSPRLLDGPHPLLTPDDLRHHTLIHLDWRARGDTWPDWRMWLLAAEAKGVDPDRGLHLSQTDLVIQAAIAGQGIALGNTSLVGDDLASGRLVQPFDLSLKAPSVFAYHLVIPTAMLDQLIVAAFRQWMLAEAGRTDTASLS